jgi:hypothetical protein
MWSICITTHGITRKNIKFILIKVPSNTQLELHSHLVIKTKLLHLLSLLKHQKQDLKTHFQALVPYVTQNASKL